MADVRGQYQVTYGEPVEVEIAIDDYADNPQNYNKHSDEQVTAIAASLKKLGQLKRVGVWRGVYVTGHATKDAAKRLGWETLKALKFPDQWPQEAVTAWLVADNETARISSPDLTHLALLVEEASAYDEELALAMSYDEERYKELLGIDSESLGGSGADAPEDFNEYGEDLETEFRCPQCGYEWSGSPK